MKYLGGKYHLMKEISTYINLTIKPEQPYWEPFLGAGYILVSVNAERKYASDINPYLMAMWNAAMNGWKPPKNLSEEQYADIRINKDRHPPELVAFAGFACSWGGKWFGGYARDVQGRNYAREGSKSIVRWARGMIGSTLFTADFLTYDPPEDNMYIYCDPPYADTTGYGIAMDWESDKFWTRVEELESMGHTILVSEYNAPSHFTCVQEMIISTKIRPKDGNEPRLEKLFMLNPIYPRIRQLPLLDISEVKTNAKAK